MNLKVEQDSKMCQDSCQIEIKIFFQDSNNFKIIIRLVIECKSKVSNTQKTSKIYFLVKFDKTQNYSQKCSCVNLHHNLCK